MARCFLMHGDACGIPDSDDRSASLRTAASHRMRLTSGEARPQQPRRVDLAMLTLRPVSGGAWWRPA